MAMADERSIRVADLLVDEQNPRLPQPNTGQRVALRAIASHQDRKLLRLADDIVQNGINPSELFMVTPTKDNPPRYMVLEGNRRLCALKGLESPDVLSGAVPTATLTALKKLSALYLENPVDVVRCLIYKNRDEAKHWLSLRHTGENDGAGVVPWGPDEKSRFRNRALGESEAWREALDFLEAVGQLTHEVREKLHTSTFKRLVDTPAVREKLGIRVEKKQLLIAGDKSRVARVLAWVVRDLIDRQVSVGDLYKLEQRKRYAKKIPKTLAVKPEGSGVPPGSAKSARSGKRKPAARRRPTRDFLIPSDCVLQVYDARTKEIEGELRRLSLQSYTNAVAVLFRVFAELSVDWYIKDQALPLSANPKLGEKLRVVGEHLLQRKRIDSQQIKPVRQAAQQGSYMGASITLMNNYVHNAAMFPAAGDLRSHWNSLQPFFAAIWSV